MLLILINSRADAEHICDSYLHPQSDSDDFVFKLHCAASTLVISILRDQPVPRLFVCIGRDSRYVFLKLPTQGLAVNEHLHM